MIKRLESYIFPNKYNLLCFRYKLQNQLKSQVLGRTADFLRCHSLLMLPASVHRILGYADVTAAFWHRGTLFINNKI